MTQLRLWTDDATPNAQPDFDASIRRVEHEDETWFSLVDVMAFFSDTEADARYYWRDTKARLEADGFQLGDKISQLKLTAKDGKQRFTDCATGQTVLRIVQSIPSPKAEPIREWLAQKGYEYLEAEANPGLETARAYQRDIERLQRQGLTASEAAQWLDTRIKQKRGNLAIKDVWKAHGIVSGRDYAALSNEVMRGATGKTATELKRELQVSNPRDYLSAAENAAVAGIELFSSILHNSRESQGVNELAEDIHDGSAMIDRDAIHRAFSKRRPDRKERAS